MNPQQNHPLRQWLRISPVGYVYWSPFLTAAPVPMARKLEAVASIDLAIDRLFLPHRCLRLPRGAYIPGFQW